MIFKTLFIIIILLSIIFIFIDIKEKYKFIAFCGLVVGTIGLSINTFPLFTKYYIVTKEFYAKPFIILLLIFLLIVSGLILLVIFTRKTEWLLWLMILALPLRIALPAGLTTVRLLFPLYFLITLAILVYMMRRIGKKDTAGNFGQISLPMLLFILVMGYSLIYSLNIRQGMINFYSFYLSFAALYFIILNFMKDEKMIKRSLNLFLGYGIFLSLFGIFEFLTRKIYFSPALAEANQRATIFRINSIFWDPNMFGKFLVVIILIALAFVFFRAPWKNKYLPLSALIICTPALILTYSRSSMLALFFGIIFLILYFFRLKGLVFIFLLCLIISGAVLLIKPDLIKQQISWKKLEKINTLSEGRIPLIKGGLRIFLERPLLGYGLGSFSDKYVKTPEFAQYEKEQEGKSTRINKTSHNTWITLLAEEGVIGLAVALFFVIAIFFYLVRFIKSTNKMEFKVVEVGILATFIAFIIHSMFYSTFFEDPFMWFILGISFVIDRVLKQKV